MFSEATFVFVLIGVAAALMASNRVRFDIVALLVVIALMLSGVLSVGESLAGFGSPVIVLVVGLLIVGESVGGPGQRERSIFELWDDYRGDRDPSSLRLTAGSSLIGQSILDSGIEQSFGLSLLGIVRSSGRHQERLITPNRDTVLMLDDVLVVLGGPDALDRIGREPGVERFTQPATERQKWLWDMGAATLLIHPDSQLIGKSLRDVAFRDRFNLEVVGLRRGGEPVVDFPNEQLAVADSLLVTGPWKSIQRLGELQHEVVLMEVPSERADVVPSYRKIPIALAILATMVGLTIFDVVPLVAAVLMAALAAVFTRCLTMEDAYRAIPWSSIALIAGMLPLADALKATGGTQMIVDALMAAVGEASPYLMLTVIFWLTALLGLVLSNTASAVLVAPIAIYAAAALGVSPYAFGVAVLIAASAAYSTPVSTPVVTLVVEPGRYRFGDFLKIGIPLLFLTYLTTLLLAPVFFPFQ